MSVSPWAATMPMQRRRGVPCFGGGGSRLEVRVTVTEAGEPEPAVAPRAERPFLSETAPTPVAPRAGADQ